MAIVKNNPFTQGLSGKLGNLFSFRQKGTKTVVALLPNPTNKPPTEARLKTNQDFRQANLYASAAMKDPEYKRIYKSFENDNHRACDLAKSDYLYKPVIEQLNTVNYKGHASEHIFITVRDTIEVKSVHIKIVATSNKLLEEGIAVKEAEKFQWKYTTSNGYNRLEACIISITAIDYPGNTTVKHWIIE